MPLSPSLAEIMFSVYKAILLCLIERKNPLVHCSAAKFCSFYCRSSTFFDNFFIHKRLFENFENIEKR
jgi:hypothetical protein